MIAWTMNKGWCLLWKCSCQTVSETTKHADHFAHTLWHVWHASDSVNGAIVYAWKANIRAYTPKNLLYIHFVYMLYIHSCRTSSLWHQLAVDKTETVIPGGVYSPVFFKLQYENLTSGSSSLIDMFASPLTACLFFSCQASQLAVGQKQFRGSLSGNDGRLDGWNEDLALQGGLLWGQLQLLWHTGQNLHRVRQQHTQTHTLGFFAYSCQQCLQGPSIRGKAQEFEETLGEEQAHTFSCSH